MKTFKKFAAILTLVATLSLSVESTIAATAKREATPEVLGKTSSTTIWDSRDKVQELEN